MKISMKIAVWTALFGFVFALPALSQYKKQVKYPLGLKHDMSREEAVEVLNSLGADIAENSDQLILASYGKRYFGIIIEEIRLQFSDDKIRSVSLKSNGEESEEKNKDRLKEFANLIRAIYEVDERSNGSTSSSSTVDTTSDIRTRFVSRYANGSYELLIYSYYLNDKYYLSFNFEKFF